MPFNYRKSVNEGGILASGYNAESYVQTPAPDATRVSRNPDTPRDKDSAEVFVPVEAMKEGVPVLRWDQALKNFEWRVLKTDDRLNFLYVLTENLEIRPGSMKDLRNANIQTIKVDSILQVLDGETALAVFTELGVMDKYLSAKSANLIKFGTTGVPYSLENTVLFLAAPKQNLKKCIEATISHAPDTKDEMEDAVRRVQSRFRSKTARESIKATAGNILSTVRLKDPDVLFDPGLTALVFELIFQFQDKKPLVEITVDAAAENPVDVALKEAATLNLNVTDTARFIFTVEECFAQRRWLSESSIVRKGVFPFLLDPNRTATALAQDEALAKLREEVHSLTQRHQGEFSGATARSHFQALVQFCDLEHAYADLCDQVSVDKRRLSVDNLLGSFDPEEEDRGGLAELGGLFGVGTASETPEDNTRDAADINQQNIRAREVPKSGFQASPKPIEKIENDEIEDQLTPPDVKRKEIGEEGKLLKKEGEEDDRLNPCPCSGRRADACSGNCNFQ